MSERTQQCYTRSVRQLVDFHQKTPERISEEQLQDYFLHRKNVDKWSAAAMRICYSGIKFFFINVLKREWHTLELIRAKREQRLPIVKVEDRKVFLRYRKNKSNHWRIMALDVMEFIRRFLQHVLPTVFIIIFTCSGLKPLVGRCIFKIKCNPLVNKHGA